jgi:hypothetical protein
MSVLPRHLLKFNSLILYLLCELLYVLIFKTLLEHPLVISFNLSHKDLQFIILSLKLINLHTQFRYLQHFFSQLLYDLLAGCRELKSLIFQVVN